MITRDFVDQCNECRKCWWILGQVSAGRIIDPKEFLAPVEDVACLPVKLRVRTNLKPPGIVEMRAHELQRENAHAYRDEQQREEYWELFSIDPQTLYLVAVIITFQPMLLHSRSNIESETSGDRKRSSLRINWSTSTRTSLNIPNSSRTCRRL